jgi:serine-type D-Ala-D-Ala carboxypeptidase/endopeptidase (penicillin-binding protein 4)
MMSQLMRIRRRGATLLVTMLLAGAAHALPAQLPGQHSDVAPPASEVAPAPRAESAAATAALARDLAAALTGSTRSGQWGVIVISITAGDTIFAHNADAMLSPASTMKMYTAAVALDRFGPDYSYRTPLLHEGSIGSDGTLQGNVYLRGVGDPSLGRRFWRSTSPLDAMATQLYERGVRRVRGDIVADASAFDGQLVPDGWKSTYLGAGYAARVSALTLDENLVWVAVRPVNGKAEVTLEPASTTQRVENTVRLVQGTGGTITATRRSDGVIVVRGTIGARSVPRRYSLVVPDPPIFIAGALHAALLKAGIAVEGMARVGRTPAGAREVAALQSPPLSQIVGEMNRESINVVAELMYRSAAVTDDQVGSAQSAQAALRQFLQQKVGVAPTVVDVRDGSGLSELNRLTARSMVEMLRYAHEAPWSAAFHASLAVEGESGTLRNRGRTSPTRANLHAKTGTTNSVASLGGYVTTRNGELLAFSYIYNGSDRWNARAAMDRMGVSLAEFTR